MLQVIEQPEASRRVAADASSAPKLVANGVSLGLGKARVAGALADTKVRGASGKMGERVVLCFRSTHRRPVSTVVRAEMWGSNTALACASIKASHALS